MQAAGLPLSDDTLNILSAYEPSGYPPSYSPSASYSPASASPGASYSEHKPKTPPPDLPSLLLDSRIVYIGMPVSQFKFIRGGGSFQNSNPSQRFLPSSLLNECFQAYT